MPIHAESDPAAVIRDPETSPPFCDPFWLDAWFEAFAPDQKPVAMGPIRGLLRADLRLHGLRLRALLSPTNDHTPSYEWPSITPDELVRYLCDSRREWSWDVMDLQFVPEHSPTHICLQGLPERGWPVEIAAPYSAPVIDLTMDKEEYFGQISKRLRLNTNRAENGLRRLGSLEAHEVSAREDWLTWLEHSFEVERSGWKGSEGSAISQRAAEKAFYTKVLGHARNEGRLRLFVLLLNVDTIAFSTLVREGRTYYGLKTGYRGDLAKFSTGNVLMRRLLHALFQDGDADRINMLSPTSEWKARWATGTEAQLYVRVYGPGMRSRILKTMRRIARRPVVERWRKRLQRK